MDNLPVAEIRNSGTFARIHQSVCSDSDWEEQSFVWRSGSGLKDGSSLYAAKIIFMLRSMQGEIQIKDLVITKQGTEVPVDPPAETSIVIDNVTADGETLKANISVENPSAETESGTLLAAVYDSKGICTGISIVNDGIAEFKAEGAAYIKAFLWNAVTGEKAMQPLLPSAVKALSAQ